MKSVKLVTSVTFSVISSNKLKFVMFGVVNSVYPVKLVGPGVVAAGQVQEQLQQSILGKGDLNTGQPGYQFWKARGSPLAQRDQDLLWLPLEELIESLSRYLRRPTQ